MKVVISFSGGRTSAYMTANILQYYKCVWDEVAKSHIGMTDNGEIIEAIVVFANTGKERIETLEFINQCDQYWGLHVVWIEAITNSKHGIGVASKIVSFETASRNGEPFEAMIAKHGIPNMASPHCSRELKKYAIQAYARSIGWSKYWQAIGFRIDEKSRANKSAEKVRHIYPLIHLFPKDKQDINKFWSDMPFDLKLKGYEGNCNKCWKKSLHKLLTIELEEREKGKRDTWWEEMEKRYGEYIPASRKHNNKIMPPFTFYRNHTSASQLAELSKGHFAKAQDDSRYIDGFRQLALSLNGTGCEDSCEPF